MPYDVVKTSPIVACIDIEFNLRYEDIGANAP